eukprot:6665791-Prymnesium_polylepis.1
MGIAYTHWQALEPRSGALRTWMQPVGGPVTSPPHGNRDTSSPPHMPLGSAGKHRQRSPTDVPDLDPTAPPRRCHPSALD